MTQQQEVTQGASAAFILDLDVGEETLTEDTAASELQSPSHAPSRSSSAWRSKSKRSLVAPSVSMTSAVADVDEAANETQKKRSAKRGGRKKTSETAQKEAEKLTSTKLVAASDDDEEESDESIASPQLSPIRAVHSRRKSSKSDDKWASLKTSYRPGSSLLAETHSHTPPTITKRSSRSRRVLSECTLVSANLALSDYTPHMS